MYRMAKLTLEFNMDKTVQYVQRIALDLRPRNTKVTNEGSIEDLISKYASLLLSLYSYHYNYCCGATEGSEQQHNQDLKEIYKGRRILEFITFYHNALHLTTLFTTMHCI